MAPPRIRQLIINEVSTGRKKIKRTRQFCPGCEPPHRPISGAHINVIAIEGENFAGGTAKLEHDRVPIYIVHQLVCLGSDKDQLIVWFVVPDCRTADEEKEEPDGAFIGALTVTVTTTEPPPASQTDPDVEPE